MLDLGVRDLIELALIWWEESQLLLEYRRRSRDRLEYIAHKARHGDVNAQLYIDILNWADETLLILTKMYLEMTRDLPISEWAKVRLEFPRERQVHPMEDLRREIETLASKALDYVYRKYYARGDGGGFIKLFTQLPYKLRKWYLDLPYTRKMIEELVGPEMMEILDKARIEVKVVLDVEDVVPLIATYGSNWRERLREIVKKAVETEVGRLGQGQD